MMPWTTRKRQCKQSDGSSGSYVVLKKKSSGGTEQASCHTSEKKAKGSIGARYANEGKMRITERRLRGLIRSALLNEWTEGYSVPDFENTESMMLFLDELEPDETVETDVVDPETGEIWLEAGMTPLEAGLVEVEEEEAVEESDPDELDNYDWDAYEREMEQKARAQRELDDKMQDKIMTSATESGKDWGADTLYQARANPDMWQRGDMGNQWNSPEEYVLGFGQDAAGDVAQSLEYTFDSNEEHDWYSSLPTKEPKYYDRDAGRPTKQILKDIYADYFYDGVSQAVEEAKKGAA